MRLRPIMVQSLFLVALSGYVLVDCSRGAESYDVERNLEYAQQGEDSLRCDVRVPRGDGPFPAVLCVHGGAWRMGNKEQMNRIADRLAEDGYTCVSINYRLAPKHRFPAQIEDCRAAVAWMRAHQDKLKLDPKRIAGFGYSAGGHLVSLLATADVLKDEPDTRLQCVVAGGAPCDFRPLPAKWDFLAYWLGGTREANPEAYELASPMKYVTADDPPAFFYHGEEDKLVPRFSPEQMVESLKKAGVDASIYLVPKAGHIEAFFSDDAVGKAISFLNLQLKGVPAKQ